jgi:hypothetical protein
VIRAWWSLRSLVASHWLIEHGFDPDAPGCEFDALRSRMQEPYDPLSTQTGLAPALGQPAA